MPAELYPFAPAFERHVVMMLCTSAQFYGAFVEGLDDAAFPSSEARLLLSVCRLFHKEVGRGPGSSVILEQRLRRHHDDGKVFMDDMLSALDYLYDAVERDDAPDEEVVRAELAAVVARRVTAKAMEDGFLQFAQKGDMTVVAHAIASAQSIGKMDVSSGDTIDTLVQDLEESASIERLSTGCVEIDRALGGTGMRRGELHFALAPTKTGKSLWLVQEAVLSARAGWNTLAVTLELPSNLWRARWLAGFTGTPVLDIITNPSTTSAVPRYKAMITRMRSSGQPIGHFACKKMPAGATGWLDVLELVKREEDRIGAQIHTLVVDYLDKMRGRDTRQKMYEQMLEVYESARLDAEDNQRFTLSASQAKGHVKEGDMPELGDCADSQNKVRVTDGMLGLQKHVSDDLRGKVSMRLLAVRNGEETGVVGPFDFGAEYGVFLKSVADQESSDDVAAALRGMPDDDYELGVFR